MWILPVPALYALRVGQPCTQPLPSSLAHTVGGARGRQNQSCMLCTPCLAVFPTLYSTRFKSGDFGGRIKGRMNYDVSLLAKTVFSTTSQLRHHYVLSCKYWWDVTIFQSHGFSGWFMSKRYEQLSKFVKFTAKLLLVPFFQTWCIYILTCREKHLNNKCAMKLECVRLLLIHPCHFFLLGTSRHSCSIDASRKHRMAISSSSLIHVICIVIIITIF